MGGYRTVVDFLTGWRLMLRQLCLSVFYFRVNVLLDA